MNQRRIIAGGTPKRRAASADFNESGCHEPNPNPAHNRGRTHPREVTLGVAVHRLDGAMESALEHWGIAFDKSDGVILQP